MHLKNLASINMGYSFRSRIEPFENGNVFIIQMKDLMNNNTVNCKQLTRIHMSNFKENHKANKGDLLFRSRGHISTSAVIKVDPGIAIISAPLIRIRIIDSSEIIPEYLNWYIRQKEAQDFFSSMANGIAQRMISKQIIEKLDVPVPPLNRQRTIVELSMSIDKEKKLFETVMRKKDQYASNIMMQFIKERCK